MSPSWGSNNPAKKCLFFSIRSLFLKFQLLKAIHYENGDTLNLHDTRKGTFFFFNTPLFCHQELKALQSKRKDKSSQEHRDLRVSGKERNSGQFQRDLNFSIKIQSWELGRGRYKKGKE